MEKRITTLSQKHYAEEVLRTYDVWYYHLSSTVLSPNYLAFAYSKLSKYVQLRMKKAFFSDVASNKPISSGVGSMLYEVMMGHQ
jgi:hypothetical protein